MIVAITGGRTQHIDPDRERVLVETLEELGATELRHGGCRGIDVQAGKVAKRLGIAVRVFPADWSAHGRAAGPIRNAEMVRGADVLLAYPGGRGTANCVEAAKRAGVPDLRAMF